MKFTRKTFLLIVVGLIIGLLNRNCLYALSGGTLSPEFTIVDAEGEEISLSQMEGKPVLLLFVDDSELSQEKLSQLAAIYDYYSVSTLKIVPVVAGMSPEKALEFQDELWLTYTLYGDPENTLAKLYHIETFPNIVLLDNNHLIRYTGKYEDNEELQRELFKWMEEKVIVITARQFEFEPNIIKVNKGDKLIFKLISEDVEHGMFIDGYELFVDQYLNREGEVIDQEKREHKIKPGEMGLLKFVANKPGRFSMRCASTCAAYHPYMIGWLRVAPNRRFGIALILIFLAGILSFWYFSKEKNIKRILGIFPLAWRFEITQFPIIKNLCKNKWIPFLGIVFNIFFFTVILVACFVGGVSAGNFNFGIMFVWIVWYVLLMTVMVPFFSRIFCAVCPLPTTGIALQRLSFLGGKRMNFGLNKKWPKFLRNMWLVNFLFLGTTFANGYLTTRPIASFIMFASIIALATILSLIYEKRSFCRYVCPVGGFQGLYSNLSLIELRAKNPDVCSKHPLKTCFIGSAHDYGCPWLEHPYAMKRNTYCGLCLECMKACPKDNIAINIRPPGTDLLVDEKRGLDESWKAFIMIGCAVVFYVFMMGPWGSIKDWQNAKTLGGLLKYISSHFIFTMGLLPLSFGIAVLFSRWLDKSKAVSYKKLFINYSYTLVPLGLMIWVAFSLGFLLPNGSYVIAVISDPFAWGWNLFGTAEFPWTPFLTFWMPYLQVAALIFGLIFSIDIACKIARQTINTAREAMYSCIPITVYLMSITGALLWLFMG